MKRVVAFIVLVFFTLNCSPVIPKYKYDAYQREQPVVISERVGEVIDPEEREQFGLFLGIEEFKEARFFLMDEGGYVVEIVTDSVKLVGTNRDPDAVAILRDYIDRHEVVSSDQTSFVRKWDILDFDILGIPITEGEATLIMRQSRRQSVKGGLVGCVGSILVSLLVGYGVAATGSGSGTDIGPALGAAAGVVVLGGALLIGLLVVGTSIAVTYSQNVGNYVEIIKEARKPEPY